MLSLDQEFLRVPPEVAPEVPPEVAPDASRPTMPSCIESTGVGVEAAQGPSAGDAYQAVLHKLSSQEELWAHP